MSSLFLSGLKHCHRPHLHSYVIRERVDSKHGMIRAFDNCGDSLGTLKRGGQFSLAPHNHRQDITLYRLTGCPLNVSFNVDRQIHTRDFTEYKFDSGIVEGEIAIRYSSTVDLVVSDVQPIPRGGVDLRHSSVHTVIAQPGDSWLVVEGEDAPAGHRSLCYGYPGLILSSEGLYEPMHPAILASREQDNFGIIVTMRLGAIR